MLIERLPSLNVGNNLPTAYHCLSKIFQPLSVVPKESTNKRTDLLSKSQKLMLQMGIIKQSTPGCYHLLPLGVKALEKLIKLVDEEMQKVGGQKIILPTLTNEKLWKKSGRLKEVQSELFMLKDRHDQKYLMSPTHEEAICDMLSVTAPYSYRLFPLKLYQITNKYRDEIKPRFGLMRGRQFLMKDLYSFDIDHDNALKTYETICESYDNILRKIGVEHVKVLASNGAMGGSLSHEFHYLSSIGEDTLLFCQSCSFSCNVELASDNACPNCKSQKVTKTNGIEVGHTFILGEKYSKPLKATYVSRDSKISNLYMGSYGLGLTRILAAGVEIFSTEEEIRWPKGLAPYTVIIIPPKQGSKEEAKINTHLNELCTTLEEIPGLKNNILLDDRTEMTIGRRLVEAKHFGHPFILVLGSSIMQDNPQLELFDLSSNKQLFLNISDVYTYIKVNI